MLENLNMLENIIAVMPGNVYWMNREGIYLGCNDNEAQAVGLKSRFDIVGKRNIDISGFVIPDVLDQINQNVMKTGEVVVIEEPAILKDGTPATFLSSKVPLFNSDETVIGMVGISIDITERKEAEKSLKMAKELAEAANQTKTEFLANMRHDLRTPFSGILGLTECMEQEETDAEKKEISV
jgi:PAS domain S-box